RPAQAVLERGPRRASSGVISLATYSVRLFPVPGVTLPLQGEWERVTRVSPTAQAIARRHCTVAAFFISQCQTARAHNTSRSRGAIAPGSLNLASTPEGWWSADRRIVFKCRASGRDAPRIAGRTPFGAPPWRFSGRGPRFRLQHFLRSPCSELLAARSYSAWRSVSRTSRGAVTSRRRRTPHLAPHSGTVSGTRPSMSETNVSYTNFDM